MTSRERVLADIQRQSPKFIIAKPERVAQKAQKPSSPSPSRLLPVSGGPGMKGGSGLYRRR